MIRALGAALLLGGGLVSGLAAGGELSHRVRDLEAWVAALGQMESELAFRGSDLRELLKAVAEGTSGPAKDMLNAAAATLIRLREQSFSKLWREVLEGQAGDLSAGDVDVLSRLGDVLGRYGREEQRRMLAALRAELEERLAGARREEEKKGKLYGMLGLTLGVFLTILLI